MLPPISAAYSAYKYHDALVKSGAMDSPNCDLVKLKHHVRQRKYCLLEIQRIQREGLTVKLA
jgi:hypothetical protein